MRETRRRPGWNVAGGSGARSTGRYPYGDAVGTGAEEGRRTRAGTGAGGRRGARGGTKAIGRRERVPVGKGRGSPHSCGGLEQRVWCGRRSADVSGSGRGSLCRPGRCRGRPQPARSVLLLPWRRVGCGRRSYYSRGCRACSSSEGAPFVTVSETWWKDEGLRRGEPRNITRRRCGASGCGQQSQTGM